MGAVFRSGAVDEDLVPSYPAPVPASSTSVSLYESDRAGWPRYPAPTDLPTLLNKGYDYWALGHCMRGNFCASGRVFCFGEPARPCKETGAKGCELVTVEAGRIE